MQCGTQAGVPDPGRPVSSSEKAREPGDLPFRTCPPAYSQRAIRPAAVAVMFGRGGIASRLPSARIAKM